MTNTPLDALRHHVTGAIERGEKQAIIAKEAPKHTPQYMPGPYYVTETACHEYMVQSSSLEHDNFICTVEGRDPVEALATANLLAAAPDLLAALITLEKMVSDGDWTLRELTEARAAIAKATGRI